MTNLPATFSLPRSDRIDSSLVEGPEAGPMVASLQRNFQSLKPSEIKRYYKGLTSKGTDAGGSVADAVARADRCAIDADMVTSDNAGANINVLDSTGVTTGPPGTGIEGCIANADVAIPTIGYTAGFFAAVGIATGLSPVVSTRTVTRDCTTDMGAVDSTAGLMMPETATFSGDVFAVIGIATGLSVVSTGMT